MARSLRGAGRQPFGLGLLHAPWQEALRGVGLAAWWVLLFWKWCERDIVCFRGCVPQKDVLLRMAFLFFIFGFSGYMLICRGVAWRPIQPPFVLAVPSFQGKDASLQEIGPSSGRMCFLQRTMAEEKSLGFVSCPWLLAWWFLPEVSGV